MRLYFTTFLILFLFSIEPAMAQVGDTESDPEARKILDGMREKYDGYPSLAIDFELGIQGPESPEEVQEGKLIRQGQQYKLDLGNQSMLSDGEALFLILHNNKEVQINDLIEDEANVLSPQALFTFYQNGQYLYILANELSRAGRVVQQIEFKPLDRDSEYFKIRLELDKLKKEPIQVIAFGRDGSRYSIRFKAFKPGKALPEGQFAFSESDYPGYYVEDLRQ